jgi:N-methylhydantoinase A
MGMLVSEPGRELSRALLKSLAKLTDTGIKQEFQVLEDEAKAQLTDEGCDPESITFRHQLELRYKGQSATIPINWSEGGRHEEAFHEAHAKTSGLRLPHPIELVNIRLGARAPAVLKSVDIQEDDEQHGVAEMVPMPELGFDVPLYQRRDLKYLSALQGPAIITEPVSTTWIKPGWKVETDKWGNLLVDQSMESKEHEPRNSC